MKKTNGRFIRRRATEAVAPAIFLIFMFVLMSARAAQAASMDIKEAIELTLRDNLSLLSLREEARKAYAFKLQADGARQPEIGLNAYIDNQREDQTSDGSGRYDNRVARATLSQTLYSGGRNSALQRQAVQVKSIADLSLIDAENRAIGELFARFYNVLLREDVVETERSAALTSEAHLREVTKMSELGLSNRLEVIRAQQQLAANRALLTSAEGTLSTAIISLMNYMALPPEERIAVKGELAAIDINGSYDGSLSSAMSGRADRARLAAQYEYQKDQIEVERSAARPKVALGASAGHLNPYNRTDGGDDTWRAELSITVPILDRNAARAGVLRAQAVEAQDRINIAQKDLDIKSEIETAWIELETTRENIGSTNRALELAEETLRLAEIGFQEGVTPQLDLLNAQSSLTASRLEHLRALYNHTLAVVALKVTEGDIIKWAGERDFR
ncbi:hypothetical protein FACS1894216_15030 [Synergistales bacterium]|nr:hypothetical protein FACS1894216_15030 [Synergistales bacterium]